MVLIPQPLCRLNIFYTQLINIPVSDFVPCPKQSEAPDYDMPNKRRLLQIMLSFVKSYLSTDLHRNIQT